MTPIEEFSQIAPTLSGVAASIAAAFPGPENRGSRFNLFVAAATEEAKLRQYQVDALIPFFQHFHNVHETSTQSR